MVDKRVKLPIDTLYGDTTEKRRLQAGLQNPGTFVKSKWSKIEEQKETLKSCMCNYPHWHVETQGQLKFKGHRWEGTQQWSTEDGNSRSTAEQMHRKKVCHHEPIEVELELNETVSFTKPESGIF